MPLNRKETEYERTLREIGERARADIERGLVEMTDDEMREDLARMEARREAGQAHGRTVRDAAGVPEDWPVIDLKFPTAGNVDYVQAEMRIAALRSVAAERRQPVIDPAQPLPNVRRVVADMAAEADAEMVRRSTACMLQEEMADRLLHSLLHIATEPSTAQKAPPPDAITLEHIEEMQRRFHQQARLSEREQALEVQRGGDADWKKLISQLPSGTAPQDLRPFGYKLTGNVIVLALNSMSADDWLNALHSAALQSRIIRLIDFYGAHIVPWTKPAGTNTSGVYIAVQGKGFTPLAQWMEARHFAPQPVPPVRKFRR